MQYELRPCPQPKDKDEPQTNNLPRPAQQTETHPIQPNPHTDPAAPLRQDWQPAGQLIGHLVAMHSGVAFHPPQVDRDKLAQVPERGRAVTHSLGGDLETVQRLKH